MAILGIKIYPDKILRKKAVPIGKIDQGVRKLAYDMIETMRRADGVGLAGPQVGIGKRIIVVQDAEGSSSAIALINPRILSKKGSCSFCEGCLSVPGIKAPVRRADLTRSSREVESV